MEVDRVSQMGGVGREARPAWQRSTKQRRRFIEEQETSESDREEENAPENTDEPAVAVTLHGEEEREGDGSEEGSGIDVMA